MTSSNEPGGGGGRFVLKKWAAADSTAACSRGVGDALVVVEVQGAWMRAKATAASKGGWFCADDGGYALPAEQKFWDDLLLSSRVKWGLAVYEQDWLYTEFLGLNATLQSSATGAKKWLTQMATAAAHVGVTVQYCMELCGNQISGAPRHRRDVVS